MSRSVPVANKAEPVSDAEAAAWFADLSTSQALVLAVSGGPDSMALCLLAARWRTAIKAGPALLAITVDHGLRAESRREAAMVKRFAASLGIAHRTLHWTGPKPATGMQEAARTARYRLLEAAARRAGARHVLTAHTLDDQAETVLFRLARGSGLSGLAAMARVAPLPTMTDSSTPFRTLLRERERERSAPRRERTDTGAGFEPEEKRGFRREGNREANQAPNDGFVLVRPFLDVPKARLIATLAAARIPYADDPTNHDPRFARPRLRAIMPALAREGLTAERLARIARRARRANEAIEAAVDALVEKLAPPVSVVANAGAPAPRSLPLADWVAAPAEIRLRLLGRLIAIAGDEGPVELGKLERCEEALTNHLRERPERRFRRTLAGAVVSFARGLLAVGRAPPRRAPRVAPAQDAGAQTGIASVHQPPAK